jgi:uncharacterized FlgJ-related protein
MDRHRISWLIEEIKMRRKALHETLAPRFGDLTAAVEADINILIKHEKELAWREKEEER